MQITFKPDLARFGMTHLEEDSVALLRKRVYDMAGVLGKHVKVRAVAALPMRLDTAFPSPALLLCWHPADSTAGRVLKGLAACLIGAALLDGAHDLLSRNMFALIGGHRCTSTASC